MNILAFRVIAVFLFLSVSSSLSAAKLKSVEPSSLFAGKGGDLFLVFDDISDDVDIRVFPGGSYIRHELAVGGGVEKFALHDDHLYMADKNSIRIVANLRGEPEIVGTVAVGGVDIIGLAIERNKMFVVDDAQLLYVYALDKPHTPELKGKYRVDSAVKSIAAMDDFCYLLLLSGEIIVIDIADYADFITAFYLDTEKRFERFAVHDSRLLAVDGRDIVAFDVSLDGKLRYRSTYRAVSSVLDIVVHRDTAYLALQGGELLLLDVTDPGQLVWLGSHANLADIRWLSYNDKKVLAATNQGVQYLIDVNNPAQPVVINSFSEPGNKWRQAALLDDGSSVGLVAGALRVVDLSFSAPQISNENLDFGQGVNFGGQRRAVIQDNIMYVADWFSGIHIYDISQADNPQLLSSFHTPGSPKGIVVRNGYAYVADDDYGLQIIDVSRPSNPSHVSELITGGLAYTPVLVGERLFLASHHGGFHIIDVSDVAAPKVIAEYDTPGKAWSLAVKDEIVYVADTTSGLLIFDVSNPGAIKHVTSFAPGYNAEDILIRGDVAYVAFFDGGLYILDIKDPYAPNVLSHVKTPGNARGLALKGDYLYLADWRAGMHIIDVADNSQPVILGSYDTKGASWGVKVENDHAYVLDWWGGLVVLDVSSKKSPALVLEYNQRGIVQQTATFDNYLIAVSGEGSLQVFDIKNPLHPTWITTLDSINQASALTLMGRVAYVADDSTEITAVDLSDPFNIELSGTIKISNKIDSIKNSQGKIYTADYGSGLTILDPKRPEYQLQYKTELNDFCFDDTSIYIAVASKGILKLDKQTLKPTGHYMKGHDISRVVSDGSTLFTSDMSGKVSVFDLNSEILVSEYEALEPVVDMALQEGRLYVVLATRELLVFDYRKNKRLALDSRYELNNPVSDMTLHKDILYFSGAKMITALKPLAALQISSESDNTFKATLPENMAEGGYDVVVMSDSKVQQRFHNVFEIKSPRFSKPKISNEKYKQLLQQQLQKNRNLQ